MKRIICAAVALVCAAAVVDGAERRIVTRGPLGFRRQVVIERGPQAVRLPRQSAIILPHSQQIVVPQQLVVPHSFGAQSLIIVR